MQKRGQDACPSCRAPVVLNASASKHVINSNSLSLIVFAENLDNALQSFLLLWFPEEVKAKKSSNENEVAKEQVGKVSNTFSASFVAEF